MRRLHPPTHESQVIPFRRPGQSQATTVAQLRDEELDERIRWGWEEWVEIQERLLATRGMLPSREIAEQATAFFSDSYWRAEEAHQEVLRRQRGRIRLGRATSQRGLELA
jgi:hypothetical protein